MITSRVRCTLVAAVVAVVLAPPALGCAEDLDRDGAVGFTDLTQLLGAWGDCIGFCDAGDFDGDLSVGFTDLTRLLGAWGPCPEDVYACQVPLSDPELAQIGLESIVPEGSLELPVELYDRIVQDVTAIRSQFGLESHLHQCRWIAREIFLFLDREGPRENYDAMNAFFCANVRHSFGNPQTEFVQLGFPCNLNPMVLSAMYQEQTEVIGADPNYVVGGSGSSWTPEVLGGGVWSWTLEISFHDCTVGCACHKQYIFFTEPNDDPVLVWESSVVGPEYCPEVPEPLSPEALDFVKSFCNYQ